MLETTVIIEKFGIECEDNAEILDLGSSKIFVLGDGAGGTGGGKEASSFLINLCKTHFTLDSNLLHPSTWENFLLEADQRITNDVFSGETTAIVFVLKDNIICGASVGDSESCLIAETCQLLTAHQFRKPLLGSGMAIPVQIQPVPMQGTLIIASDGLFRYTTYSHICDVVVQDAPLSEVADSLVKNVRLPSGELQDDVSIILARQV